MNVNDGSSKFHRYLIDLCSMSRREVSVNSTADFVVVERSSRSVMNVLAMDVFRHASLLAAIARGGGRDNVSPPEGKVQWLEARFVRHARLRRHVNSRPVSPLLSRVRESEVDFIAAMKRF